MQLTDVMLNLAEVLFILLLSPLLTGVIRKVKAWMQCRQGPSVLQPYRDIWKLLRKSTWPPTRPLAVPHHPVRVPGGHVCLAVMVPVFTAGPSGGVGDMVAVIYVLGLFRFMMVLGGLEGEAPSGHGQQPGDDDLGHRGADAAAVHLLGGPISGTTDLSAISSTSPGWA
jgi:hydrogenase-4 component C